MASNATYLESLFDSKRRPPQKESPKPDDSKLDDVSVWQVLASQTEYLQKLEQANKKFHEESKFLRENLRSLVEDNSRLYSELKTSLSQRIEELADQRSREDGAQNGKLEDEDQQEEEEEEEVEREEVAKNEPEEERQQPKALSGLVRMHATRAERLESEVRALKTQLDSSRLVIGELKKKTDTSSAGSTSSVQVDADSMLKLMNERDEAVGRIARLVERLNVCDQHRQALEADLRDALKLVDEAVREKQMSVDEKMRLSEKLEECERRVEEERETGERRLEQAVKIIRGAAAEQIKAAEDKMTMALAESLRHEQKASRLAKEQRKLANELEQVRQEATKFEQELSDANSDFKATLARVLSDRDVALRELSRLRALTSQERGDGDSERSRLTEQLRAARGQIGECQQELNAIAAERLNAVSQMNDALAQVEAERRMRGELEDEVEAVRRELSSHAQSLKQQHEATGGELRKVVEQQADLIKRLRTECDRLLAGYSSEKSEADRLRAENALLLSRLRRSQEELGAARFDASASAQVQDALRWRMAELDARAKQAKQEVDDLLARSHGSLRTAKLAQAELPSAALNKSLNALKNEELLGLGSSDDSLVNEILARRSGEAMPTAVGLQNDTLDDEDQDRIALGQDADRDVSSTSSGEDEEDEDDVDEEEDEEGSMSDEDDKATTD